VSRPEDVLQFWLGAPGDPPLRNQAKWWRKDPAFDEECRAKFGDLIDAGARGDLADWKQTPHGRLGLVVLFDQLSRNVHRGTARSFAQDNLARDVALDSMAKGDENAFSLIERSFLYMPLMHAEDVSLQHQCVASFNRIAGRAEGELKKYLEMCHDYAKKHEEIVERFGRFPHRNAILGRPSTAEEQTFLQQPGSSF
jgi:uncharacterized protein (DUF924 family)